MAAANCHVFKPRPPQNVMARRQLFFFEALWESTSQVVKRTFRGKKILLINWSCQRESCQLWQKLQMLIMGF